MSLLILFLPFYSFIITFLSKVELLHFAELSLDLGGEVLAQGCADIRNAAVDGAKLFFLEVRESNTPAIALYKKLGFTKSGMRNNYYTNPVENAVLMSKCVTRDSLI